MYDFRPKQMTTNMSRMTPQTLNKLRKRLLTTLVEKLDEVAFIPKGLDVMAELTKPLSLALQDALLSFVLEHDLPYSEDVQLMEFSGTIVAKHTLNIDGISFVGVGEGVVSEAKDNAARTAETRAHKRVLDKLLGYYAHALLVWVGSQVSQGIRALDKAKKDKYFSKDTPVWEREKILREVAYGVIEKSKPALLERIATAIPTEGQ